LLASSSFSSIISSIEFKAIVVPAEEVNVEELGGEAAEPVSPLALSGTLVRAVSLFDRALELADGRSVGSIRDFVIDATTGQLLYSVVAYDELFGLSGTQVAPPLATLGGNAELRLSSNQKENRSFTLHLHCGKGPQRFCAEEARRPFPGMWKSGETPGFHLDAVRTRIRSYTSTVLNEG
jgi:hypothetical protein